MEKKYTVAISNRKLHFFPPWRNFQLEEDEGNFLFEGRLQVLYDFITSKCINETVLYDCVIAKITARMDRGKK